MSELKQIIYFRQTSPLGPWYECEAGDIGAVAFVRRTQPEATKPAEVEFVNRPGEASLIMPVQDCTEPNRENCPRRCIDFCNKAEQATTLAQDLSAAILTLPYPQDENYERCQDDFRTGFDAALKAAAAVASPADALVAGDRETTTSDSENCAHLTNCPGCDKCEALLEHYMACDECGSWGNKEANGWTKTSGNQFVCESCAAIQAQKDGHG